MRNNHQCILFGISSKVEFPMKRLLSEELALIQQELDDIKETLYLQTVGVIPSHRVPVNQRQRLLSVIARLQGLCITLHISLQSAQDKVPYASIPQWDASRNN
jgi:tRNA A37 methylthiotransferase MiaB